LNNLQFSALLLLTSLSACGGTSSDSTATTNTGVTTQYLAKNIVFTTSTTPVLVKNKEQGFSFMSKANAATVVDTTTKIDARNVIFSPKATSSITSSDVQAALEEISLTFKDTMIGTWNIKNIEAGKANTIGKILINPNGTFNLISGDIAVLTKNTPKSQYSFITATSQKFTIITDEVILFEYENNEPSATLAANIPPIIPDPTIPSHWMTMLFSAIPTAVSVKSNEIILTNGSTISILTRI